MHTPTPYSPGRALRALDTTLRVAKNILTFITVLAIVFLLVAVTGRGTMTVEADLDDPYFIEFADGRRVGVSGQVTTFENFEIGRERDHLADVGDVGLTISVSRNDTDSRAVLGAMILGWLAAAWIGLHSLSRVVTSAVDGATFADENPSRLRRLGAAVIAVPVIGVLGTFILNRTVEVDIPATIGVSGTSVWVMEVIGLAVFALAEVFAEAARLREFEESTI